MNINEIMSSSSELFRKGKFIKCCELLQSSVDSCYLKNISLQNEVEFIILRNNLLICNCLKTLITIDTEYVSKMSEIINIAELYLYEKHIPLELRVNFVCNALHWYWWKPIDVLDYCYNKIMTIISECLHQVLYENGNSIANLSSFVNHEEDILNSLECLSNRFLSLKPILVVQCLEISQILLLVFLSRCSFDSLLVQFTVQFLDQFKTIAVAFKHKKFNQISNCFKFGLSKINVFLDIENIKTIIVSSHVSLCIKYVLENQHRQALCTLSTVDQYMDSNDELYCLMCYLKALVNFNLEEFEVTLYYLSEMVNCLMEPFIKSRYFLLLGRTHSKIVYTNHGTGKYFKGKL
uniref:Uncharacterized protein n=1 Tax=Sipha flava TaxID=143950 RepID=A0A2S2PWC2_9HEMI